MGFVQKNIFEELDKVRWLVQERLPGYDVHNLCLTLGRLGTYHYHKKSMLVGDERKLYNLLIENSYNPYTVYRWALLERIPEEIKFQLRNYYISQKKASQTYFQQRHKDDLETLPEIKMLGLGIIREM